MIIEEELYQLHKKNIPSKIILLIKDDNIKVIYTKQEVKINQTLSNTPLASLIFTSGSTGTPKAVMISHKNIIANTKSIIEYLSLNSSDRIFTSLPLHYCFGLSVLHTHLRVGGMVIFNHHKRIKGMLNYLFLTQSNSIAGVPSFFQIMLRNSCSKKYNFNSIKKIQQAGGRLAPIFVKELKHLYSKCTVA